MERLLIASNAPYSPQQAPLHLAFKAALIMGTVASIVIVFSALPSAETAKIHMYTAVEVAQPSVILGTRQVTGRQQMTHRAVNGPERSHLSSSVATFDTPSSSQALEPSSFNVLRLLPVLGIWATLAAFLFRRHGTSAESTPLMTGTHHCIAMASVTSEQPTVDANAAAGPRKRILVVGATGYIGKYATLELIKRGYDVVVMTRERSGIGGKKSKDDVIAEFPGAEIVFGDVCDQASVNKVFQEHAGQGFDTIVSCLASRTGGVADSWKIDYQATSNVLQAARANKSRHFILLSAICVQKPLLEFQRAKLKFEEELMSAGDISYSIVRPTAFFKSLAGQVKSVMGGGPYVMFGDGQLAACKPISERDLASFMADCVEDETKFNKVLPIGGPGEALTPLQQGNMLFSILDKEPFFIKVPVGLMDFVIGLLDFFKQFNKDLVDAAEFGRIGKYYATESMLVYDPATQKYLPGDATPSYGNDTLEDFFRTAVKEGGLAGQELGDAAIFGD